MLCDASNDWLVWQLIDSAFPAGAFAHSGGLEAAWRAGLLLGESDDNLEGVLRGVLRQAAHGVAPIAQAACAKSDDLATLDRSCHAFLTNHVANRASRAQGQAFLKAAHAIFGVAPPVGCRAAGEASYSHFAPVFGWVCNRLGLSPRQASRAILFITLRGSVSAAVRLGLIGPLAAQALQHRLGDALEGAAETAIELDFAGVCQVAPLLDLAQAGQDRLYSRLFQS